jgi:hypothetical protein
MYYGLMIQLYMSHNSYTNSYIDALQRRYRQVYIGKSDTAEPLIKNLNWAAVAPEPVD